MVVDVDVVVVVVVDVVEPPVPTGPVSSSSEHPSQAVTNKIDASPVRKYSLLMVTLSAAAGRPRFGSLYKNPRIPPSM
jgi:hypothetical protein